MELRYKKDRDYFNPEYKHKETGVWTVFREGDLPKNSSIRKLTQYIANSSAGRWDSEASWTYSNSDEIIFRNEISVAAFLGAATVFFAPVAKEFKI